MFPQCLTLAQSLIKPFARVVSTMLPSATSSELDTFNVDLEDGPVLALKRMRQEFAHRAKSHLRYARCYRLAYHTFGSLAVFAAVILSSVDGCAYPDAVFALGLTVALLTTALNFFGVETRLQKHDASKSQYESLELEIEKFLLTSHKIASGAAQVERSMFDRVKMIAQNEPDLSLCCLK